jgi:hypothetical protein
MAEKKKPKTAKGGPGAQSIPEESAGQVEEGRGQAEGEPAAGERAVVVYLRHHQADRPSPGR